MHRYTYLLDTNGIVSRMVFDIVNDVVDRLNRRFLSVTDTDDLGEVSQNRKDPGARTRSSRRAC
jgi:hypothetical protein